MSVKKVLVFDSGIGGLSIAKELLRYLPIKLDYAFDNQAFPYGNKAQDWLLERIVVFIKKALERANADLLVLACNTASTLALSKLREIFDLPIVGVVPAIKPGIKTSTTKDIIVLATPNTVASPYTQKLIDEFAINAKVHLVGDADLVNCAENLMRGEKIDLQIIRRVTADIEKFPNSDTIVLACTHYPFLKQILIANLSRTYNWIDSSMAIVNRTASLLDLAFASACEKTVSCAEMVLTSKAINNLALKQNLATIGFKKFTVLPIENN